MWVSLLISIVMVVIPLAILIHTQKNRTDLPEKKPDLKINIPGVENTSKAEIEAKTTKKEKTESLDSLYAQKSGKRLCPYCETLNDGEASSCCACGNQL